MAKKKPDISTDLESLKEAGDQLLNKAKLGLTKKAPKSKTAAKKRKVKKAKTAKQVAEQYVGYLTLMGRPLKISNEVITKLMHGIKLGLPYKAAAERAGISHQTFFTWQKKSKVLYDRLTQLADTEALTKESFNEAEWLLIDLFDQLGEAQNIGKANLLKAIVTDKSWKAKAWMLERRYPKEFGNNAFIAKMEEQEGKEGADEPLTANKLLALLQTKNLTPSLADKKEDLESKFKEMQDQDDTIPNL